MIFDIRKFQNDSYWACLNNTVCTEKVNTTNADILNYMYDRAYENITTDALDNDEWDEARERAEELYEIAKN